MKSLDFQVLWTTLWEFRWMLGLLWIFINSFDFLFFSIFQYFILRERWGLVFWLFLIFVIFNSIIFGRWKGRAFKNCCFSVGIDYFFRYIFSLYVISEFWVRYFELSPAFSVALQENWFTVFDIWFWFILKCRFFMVVRVLYIMVYTS